MTAYAERLQRKRESAVAGSSFFERNFTADRIIPIELRMHLTYTRRPTAESGERVAPVLAVVLQYAREHEIWSMRERLLQRIVSSARVRKRDVESHGTGTGRAYSLQRLRKRSSHPHQSAEGSERRVVDRQNDRTGIPRLLLGARLVETYDEIVRIVIDLRAKNIADRDTDYKCEAENGRIWYTLQVDKPV